MFRESCEIKSSNINFKRWEINSFMTACYNVNPQHYYQCTYIHCDIHDVAFFDEGKKKYIKPSTVSLNLNIGNWINLVTHSKSFNNMKKKCSGKDFIELKNLLQQSGVPLYFNWYENSASFIVSLWLSEQWIKCTLDYCDMKSIRILVAFKWIQNEAFI